MIVIVDRKQRAIVIKLFHGIAVSWDGRVIRHCTSVTDVGQNNHAFSNFFASYTE